jgi:hypothetical protein
MARKAKKRKKSRKAAPTVTVRFANPGGRSMAKRRKGGKSGKGAHRKATTRRRRKNPTHRTRRRRNPANTFMDRAAKLAGLALVAVGTGVASTFAMSKLTPAGTTMSNLVEYGIPAGVFLAGAAVMKSSPMLGAGMAAGAFAPFVLPLTSKALTATAPATPTTTAAGLGRAFRNMRAVQGRQYGYGMGAVDHPGVAAVNYTHG